jgi:hypothetical protein
MTSFPNFKKKWVPATWTDPLAAELVAQQAGNSVIHLDGNTSLIIKSNYEVRGAREMKVGSGNFVTRGILLLIFVTNRILFVSILSFITNYSQYFSRHFVILMTLINLYL